MDPFLEGFAGSTVDMLAEWERRRGG